MKTIVHFETTDEQRKRLAEAWGVKGVVSRNDIKARAQAWLESEMAGNSAPAEVELPAPEPPKPAKRDGFVPSRGDEPYIFKARDERLRQLHSNLLDAIEALEDYTWEQMERNRVQKA